MDEKIVYKALDFVLEAVLEGISLIGWCLLWSGATLWEKEVQEMVVKIANKYELRASVPPGIRSVGVGGDERSYTPVVVLNGSAFPGWEVLERVSNEITNTCPINRVTWEGPCL